MAAVTQAQGLRNNLLFAKIVCGYMATIAIYIYMACKEVETSKHVECGFLFPFRWVQVSLFDVMFWGWLP